MNARTHNDVMFSAKRLTMSSVMNMITRVKYWCLVLLHCTYTMWDKQWRNGNTRCGREKRQEIHWQITQFGVCRRLLRILKHKLCIKFQYLEKYNNQPDMANFPVYPTNILMPHFWSIHFNIILHLACISHVVSPFPPLGVLCISHLLHYQCNHSPRGAVEENSSTIAPDNSTV